MKKREFNKHLNSCCNKKKGIKKIDWNKIKELPDNVKNQMAMFIVKEGGILFTPFITKQLDMSWLRAMGYLYQTTVNDVKGYCLSKDFKEN